MGMGPLWACYSLWSYWPNVQYAMSEILDNGVNYLKNNLSHLLLLSLFLSMMYLTSYLGRSDLRLSSDPLLRLASSSLWGRFTGFTGLCISPSSSLLASSPEMQEEESDEKEEKWSLLEIEFKE